jgi:hypothetical protein
LVGKEIRQREERLCCVTEKERKKEREKKEKGKKEKRGVSWMILKNY